MAGRRKLNVLVTRAEPAASRTAELLRKDGYEAICYPLFEVVDTGSGIPRETFDAYVFTSGSAVKILQDRGRNSFDRTPSAYCVGEETAAAAKSLGFSNVISVDGTAEDLAARLQIDFEAGNERLLYLAGEQRSYDLKGALSDRSRPLEMAEIYRISKVYPESRQVFESLTGRGASIVLLYSHNTAKHVCEVLFEHAENTENGLLSAVAISAKTADAVLKYPWREVYVAKEPNQQSMFSILNEISLA